MQSSQVKPKRTKVLYKLNKNATYLMEISRNKHRANTLYSFPRNLHRFLEVAANISDAVGAVPLFSSSNADCAAGTDIASDAELSAGRISRAGCIRRLSV